jgi:imidazolonepropionase-like amidohydrolase
MSHRIIRGVRIATPDGIRPASVHIEDGSIVAVAGYEEIPREAVPEELGKSVLMPALQSKRDAEASPQEQIDRRLQALSEMWTEMRGRDEPIEDVLARSCRGQIVVGAPADFIIWNPEMTVVGTSPALYGQVRQVIQAGQCVYKEGKHLR